MSLLHIANALLGFLAFSPFTLAKHLLLILYLIVSYSILFLAYGILGFVFSVCLFLFFVCLFCSSVAVAGALLHLLQRSLFSFYRRLFASQSPAITELRGVRAAWLPFFRTLLVQLVGCFLSPGTVFLEVMRSHPSIDGYCYLWLFPSALWLPLAFVLGKKPLASSVIICVNWLPLSPRAPKFHPIALGMLHISCPDEESWLEQDDQLRIGALQALVDFNDAANDLKSVIPIIQAGASFLPTPGPSKPPMVRGGRRLKRHEARVLNAASAIASGNILLGNAIMSGTNTENVDVARQAFADRQVRTSVPPSSKLYRQLVEATGMPLAFSPSVTGHDAAATLRRAWTSQMDKLTEFGVGLLVSPSHHELHLKPNWLVWYPPLVDSLDISRVMKPCGSCRQPRCAVLQQARDDGRILTGTTTDVARAAMFYHCDYLWMINVEPNWSAAEILQFMVSSGIKEGYSVAHADWRVLGNGQSLCKLTQQTTKIYGDQVHASFSSGGGYESDLTTFKQMFAPIRVGNRSLRRTVVGRGSTSMLMELKVSQTNIAKPFVPDRESHYMIPIPHPRSGVLMARIPKEGLDRVLQLYRTTNTKSVEGARIALRQSNVTYSISGTALTPRLEISASDSEFLAIWMYAYSVMMDKMVGASVSVIDKSNEETPTSFLSSIASKLVNDTSLDGNLFGSQSAVKKWLTACTRDGRFASLEEISDDCYSRVYGLDSGIGSTIHPVLASWRKWRANHTTVDAIISFLEQSFSGIWAEIFTASNMLSKVVVILGQTFNEGFGIALDFLAATATSLNYTRAAAFLNSVREKIRFDMKGFAEIVATVRTAQALDFVSASAFIINKLETVFSPVAGIGSFDDYLPLARAEYIEAARLNGFEVDEDDEEMMGVIRTCFSNEPKGMFSIFAAELRKVLSAISGRAERIAMCKALVDTADDELGRCTDEQRTALLNLKEELPELIKSVEVMSPSAGSSSKAESRFALTGARMERRALPITPPTVGTTQVSLEAAFEMGGVVEIDVGKSVEVARTLERLPRNEDGTVDFSPIHRLMEQESAQLLDDDCCAEALDSLRVGAIRTISSDKKGGVVVTNMIRKGTLAGSREAFWGEKETVAWALAAAKDTDIGPVQKALSRAPIVIQHSPMPYALHIEGLAMAGKSKGIVESITKDDIVVTPSRFLRAEWEENLARQGPERQARVYTQHMAIGQRCEGNVYVDEAYQFDRPHLEILRRTIGGKAFITIGDGGQIDNVFSEEIPRLDPLQMGAFAVAMFPTTFCPFDAAIEMLRTMRSNICVKRNFSGSDICRGLFYQVEHDDIVIPGHGDLAINGTQKGKALMESRGIKERIVTAHEGQGMRSDNTIIHATAVAGECKDLKFFAEEAHRPHYGVAITRARVSTTFIVPDRETAKIIPYVQLGGINGARRYESDVVYSGTTYDLFEPFAQVDVTFNRCSNPVTQYTDNELAEFDLPFSLGAVMNEDGSEAIPFNEYSGDIDVTPFTKVVANHVNAKTSLEEEFVYKPVNVPAGMEVECHARATKPEGPLTGRDFAKVDQIVKEIFDKVVDPNLFYEMAKLHYATINSKTRDQVVDAAMADFADPHETSSYAFGKNEFAKSVSNAKEGSALKMLIVLGMPQGQIAAFDELIECLSEAFSKSMRPGIISPLNRTINDINDVLGSFEGTFEIDLTRQDSSHDRYHVAVLMKMLEKVAKRIGLVDLAESIRMSRVVNSLKPGLRFTQGTGLGSGDKWTLIANMIMAFSSLISRYHFQRGTRCLQIGDDITADRRIHEREQHLIHHKRVEFKIDDRMAEGRPTFTSRTAITDTFTVATRIRGLLAMLTSVRTAEQQAGYRQSALNFKREIAEIGLAAYCEAHADLWRGTKYASEADTMEIIIQRCLHFGLCDFSELPKHLKQISTGVTIHSRDEACFAYALSKVVSSNVAAVNVLADRALHRDVTLNDALETCRLNGVACLVDPKPYPKRKVALKQAVSQFFLKTGKSQGVVLFADHAIAVTSTTSMVFSLQEWRTISVAQHTLNAAGANDHIEYL